MSFADFHGNAGVVHRLREMLARHHLPQAVILAGLSGSGKYTLALMLTKAMNCLSPSTTDGLPDFCGKCSNCVRITQSEDLEARFAEAVEAREALREAERKETRLFVQTHPDVLIIPPDPPQMMIKVDQVRRVIESIYFRPGEAKERVYIFTDSAFMKEAANSLLKILEEPPEFATIFLLTENPGELLPTLRSRSMIVSLAALPADQVEKYLAKHCPDWNAKQHALVARLSEGAVGRARSFDLASYTAARTQALTILNSALRAADHSELFKVTETYRAGAEGRDKTENLLRTLYSLLQDLTFLNSGTPELVRNTDIQAELKRLAESADFAWIALAADRLAEVERGMRRNLLRSLSLDAFATALERG
ncbi:MAG: DNA polymerase III subunit delta' [Chloroflexi bacterium 13_1_20CM_2_59_7]|nr:MAG: DNA polymerase III subunit delta' [Chloroflexi bacterium 13_1_20CM_2_59_7]